MKLKKSICLFLATLTLLSLSGCVFAFAAADGIPEYVDNITEEQRNKRGSNPVLNYLMDRNFLSYKYSYRDSYFYTDQYNAWQSNFGFAKIYDLVAPFMFMEYDYIRVHFEYEGKDRMVQLWKGQYGLVFYGCEAGLYSKEHSEKDDGLMTFYKCPKNEADWATMQTTLYHDKMGNGKYTREFTTPYEKNWWSTGFKQGHLRRQEPANELRQVGTITFKNAEMASLFAEGLLECGFAQVKSPKDVTTDSFTLDGASVYYSWQDISTAENTMGIKTTAGVLIGANMLALIVGVLLFMGSLMGLGLLIFII